MAKQKKFLIAPLNWGLGHATRCIPIIRELEAQGAHVQIASDGIALALLKKEFPHLMCHELPAYNIRYPFNSMVLSMASQAPKILRGGILEYRWLQRFLRQEAIDVIISDNRFGFFSKKVKSIFMTHQINIQAPLRPLVDKINTFFIKKFDECWIPDYPNTPNLSGILGHGGLANSLNVRYVGVLSRMKWVKKDKKYKAIFVLSGPEPQRTHLEKIILNQFQSSNAAFSATPQYILVRGLPQATQKDFKIKNGEVYNYLTTADLNDKILESEVLVARSGYSTVMDLAHLKVPAILIPTPGQTEQEYLADNLMQNQLFYTQSQANLDIEKALNEVKNYAGFSIFNDRQETLKEIITELLNF